MKQLLLNVCAISSVLAGLTVAHAETYRFKFKVTSSGSDMYACNAGVLSQSIPKTICYKENSDGSRTPVDIDESCATAAKNCNSRVKCVSRDGGALYVNALTAETKDWTDHSEEATGGKPTGVVVGGIDRSGQIFSDEEAFDHKIQNLLVELNSEVYNAKYFVDICFRGPQTPLRNVDAGVYYQLVTNAGAVDFESIGETHGDNDRTGIRMMDASEYGRYTKLSEAAVQSFIVCDTKGSGVYQNATNNAGVYNTTQNEALFTLAPDHMTPTGAISDVFFPSGSFFLSGGSQDLIKSSTYDPRFCRIRYLYTETNALGSKPLFRDWKRKGAEMCTYTVVNDPSKETK